MNDNRTDLSILDPGVNRGYLSQPIPIARDAEISRLISQTLDGQQLARLARQLQQGNFAVLRVFAERMASVAVRNMDSQTLRTGLVALLLCLGGTDTRESLIVLPIFVDAVRRLSVDLDSFISELRKLVGDQLLRPFIEFLKRSEEDKSLEAMGYSVGVDKDGFRYVRTW